MEDDGQHVGGVEADVEPDKDLDEPEYEAALRGHEDAHDLKEDRKFGGEDGRRIENSVNVKQLGTFISSFVHRID